MTFNALFILSFAYIGAILAILFPNLGFGSADFYDLLLYLLQTILDGITFGFLSSYDISLSEIELHGFFADSYAYITNLIIDLALLTTVSSVIWESIETKQKLKKIIQSGHIDPNYFAILTPLKVKEVIRNISSGKLNIRTQGGYLVQMLLQSNSKEARDIMLQVMQSACNSDVFLTCLDYFHKNHDHRFWKVCKRINNKEKRAILRSKGII